LREKDPERQAHRPDDGDEAPQGLIHGFPQDRRTWPSQVAAFKEDRRRAAPDPPGSEPTHGKDLMQRFARDLSRLLQERLDQASLRGKADLELTTADDPPCAPPQALRHPPE
jgi:pimeloyl-ACP methyl ester carboxylesterase